MKRMIRWFRSQRSSTRLTFLLQLTCRVGFSLFSFIWTPLLLGSMGKTLNGVYLNFQKITSLGGLGDLGMGGVVNIRTSRLLGLEKKEELGDFLTAARGVFLVMAALAAIIFWAISPYLFHALKFSNDPKTGSLSLLALVGGVAIAFVVLNSYVSNLNYGCANLVWPVVPAFVIMQFAFLGHWLLARQHAILSVQYIPYVLAAILIHILGWFYLKKSHPSLAVVWPLRFNRKQFIDLFGDSFWVYLSAVGAGIWIATDVLLITARFGPDIIPAYQYNYRLCDLAVFVINSANLAAMSKIAIWIVSPQVSARDRGIQELMRLGRFQTLLGCLAALLYLNVNDWFMRLWLGTDYQVPVLWQIAFAASVAVAGGGQMVCNLAPRCSGNGIRVTGTIALLAAFLNLGFSFVAMELSPIIGTELSIFGIALSTVIAQTSRDFLLGRYAARQLKISWWKLSLKNWLLASGTIAFAALLRTNLPPDNFLNVLLLTALAAGWLIVIARLTGISMNDIQLEKEVFKAMIRKQDYLRE